MQRQAYLQEMGIQEWQLVYPERLENHQAEVFELPSECMLLLVSSEKPQGHLAEMFVRVLKSMKLSLNQARFVTPEQLSQLGQQQLTWIWLAGCDESMLTSYAPLRELNVLRTSLLSEIDGDNQRKRDLWQQICSFDTEN